MELRCFVRVLCDLDGETSGGTGYLISRVRVLTAAHLVGNPGTPASIEFDPADPQDAEEPLPTGTRDAVVAWRGDEDCDVALLELEQPAPLEVPVAELAGTPLKQAAAFEAKGWPLVAPDEERIQDSLVGLTGEAHSFRPAQKRFQLTVKEKAKDVTGWRGVSGAPVFQRDGPRRLLGVIADVPPDFENLLWASPLTAAFRRQGFVEALGPRLVLERREALIARAASTLQGSVKAAKEVARCKPVWGESYGSDGIQGLVSTLLGETDILEVLDSLSDAQKALLAEEKVDRDAVRILDAFCGHLAPLLVQAGLLHALPDTDGAVVLQLPVRTTTFAELAIAAFYGRPYLFKPELNPNPDGLFRLPRPGEEGFDFDGEDPLGSYAKHFKQSELASSEDREYFEELRRGEDGERRSRNAVLDLFNRRFAREARRGDPPARRYLLFHPQFADDHAEFLRKFRKHMSAVSLVELIGKDHGGEREICWALCELLERNVKAEVTKETP